MKFKLAVLYLPLLLSIFFVSCKHKVGPTMVTVVDSVRHYRPLLLGEELTMHYDLTNVGEEPLVVNDIQPSCGCIVSNMGSNLIILPGETKRLIFVYDTSGNIGYVKHTIRIYGNVLPKGEIDLIFDLNVVPPTAEAPDYEQIYNERLEKDKAKGIKEAVDGLHVDYTVDEPTTEKTVGDVLREKATEASKKY